MESDQTLFDHVRVPQKGGELFVIFDLKIHRIVRFGPNSFRVSSATII